MPKYKPNAVTKSVATVGSAYAAARKAGAGKIGAASVALKQGSINKAALRSAERTSVGIARSLGATAGSFAAQKAATKMREIAAQESIAKTAIEKGLSSWNSLINQNPNNPTQGSEAPKGNGGSAIGG